jgi:hypothetical protein
MSARLPALTQRALSTPETSEWHVTVMNALGADLANKVNACSLDSGRLTVLTDSSAWAARIRFRLAEHEALLREKTPDYREFSVRVRPRQARSGRG